MNISVEPRIFNKWQILYTWDVLDLPVLMPAYLINTVGKPEGRLLRASLPSVAQQIGLPDDAAGQNFPGIPIGL